MGLTTLGTIALRYGVRLDPPYPIRLEAGRDDLPLLCKALGFTCGAEVGVWKGDYSRKFCEAGLRWTAVDPWAPYAAYRDNKNQQDLIDQAHAEAMRTLRPFGICELRMHSVEAAPLVPDGSLDVVYLDGNHEADYIRQDLDLWIPKVRSGGLVAGHDYRVNRAKPYIQVKDAVDQYTVERRIAPWFIFAGDKTPSFMWVVP